MILSELAIGISILTGVFSIIGVLGVWIAQSNKHKTLTAVQDEKIKNQLAELNQMRFEFEKYKDKNDNKFKDVFAKIDEHYTKLDGKIDALVGLISGIKK